MNPRRKIRRRSKRRNHRADAYEAAATEILHAIDGRSHPSAYLAPELRQMALADVLSGVHTKSPPHLWWFTNAVGRIALLERSDPETVVNAIFDEANHLRPGATL